MNQPIVSKKKRRKRRVNTKGWIILVGRDRFGTDNPDRRLTRSRDRATRFDKYEAALWRAECIMYENQDKEVRIRPWK